jgi:hypothetical protein
MPRLAEAVMVPEDEKFWFVVNAAKVMAPRTIQTVTRAMLLLVFFCLCTHHHLSRVLKCHICINLKTLLIHNHKQNFTKITQKIQNDLMHRKQQVNTDPNYCHVNSLTKERWPK